MRIHWVEPRIFENMLRQSKASAAILMEPVANGTLTWISARAGSRIQFAGGASGRTPGPCSREKVIRSRTARP